MKIKKVLLLVISIFIVSISFSVKADGYNYYLSNKSLNYDYVDKNSINVMNVQRGDIIYVTSVINNTGGDVVNYQLGHGKLTLRWDANYVDLLETDGKYFNISNSSFNNLNVTSVNKTSGKLTIGDFSSSEMIKFGKNNLIEFKFQVLKNANISSFKIYQMDGEDSINCFDTVNNKNIKCAESLYSELKYNVQKSNNNKLSVIKLNGQELEFFNENVLEYDIEVEKDIEKINISAVKKDSTSVIGGDLGDKKLEYGINVFNIDVISESGEINTYTLSITRIDERSTINTLKSVTISDIDMVFVSNITEYDLNVDNKVEKITINSTLTDNKAIYEEGFDNREVKLNEGSNKVLIKILSESGEEKIYTFNITRALSGNNTLKSLFVNDKKIELQENEFIYNIEFDNEIEEAIIKAIPSDNKANVIVKDKYALEVGSNDINVDIIAADGSKASYILNITRKKILSNNSRLSNIKIIGYKINFRPDNTLYNLRIKDEEEKLDIYTVLEDEFATVEIEGNHDLIDGSIIKINVKAEDGTYTRYFINIEKSRKSNLIIIIIIILITSGLLALCIWTLIKRKKKREEGIARIKEEMIDNKELDAVGAEMDIEASDYEDEKEHSEEIVSGVVNNDIQESINNNLDNDNYHGLHEESDNKNNIN